MIFLLLGEDVLKKDEKIREIKSKFIKEQGTLSFDYELLHAHKLDAATLKKALISYPAISPKRVILIRQADKLIQQNQDIIEGFFSEKPGHIVLILETEKESVSGNFGKFLNKSAQVFSMAGRKEENVFDMTNAIAYRKPDQALKILNELMTAGSHPLAIMGALVWFWGKNSSRLSKVNFKEGLKALQEADAYIKRSRIKPEYAMEVAVIKLCELI